MRKKDPEMAKKEAEDRKIEIDRLTKEMVTMTSKVPKSVMNGSIQTAISFKETAHRALKLIGQARPNINNVRECYLKLKMFGE